MLTRNEPRFNSENALAILALAFFVASPKCENKKCKRSELKIAIALEFAYEILSEFHFVQFRERPRQELNLGTPKGLVFKTYSQFAFRDEKRKIASLEANCSAIPTMLPSVKTPSPEIYSQNAF
jgi:hypothetical protein